MVCNRYIQKYLNDHSSNLTAIDCGDTFLSGYDCSLLPRRTRVSAVDDEYLMVSSELTIFVRIMNESKSRGTRDYIRTAVQHPNQDV
jgi:hypothetical protein